MIWRGVHPGCAEPEPALAPRLPRGLALRLPRASYRPAGWHESTSPIVETGQFQVAVLTARGAWRDAGAPQVEPERFAVVIGTGTGGVLGTLARDDVFERAGIRRPSPFAVPALMPNGPAAWVSMDLGVRFCPADLGLWEDAIHESHPKGPCRVEHHLHFGRGGAAGEDPGCGIAMSQACRERRMPPSVCSNGSDCPRASWQWH